MSQGWQIASLRGVALLLGLVHLTGMAWFIAYYPLWLLLPGIGLLLIGLLSLNMLERMWSGFLPLSLLAIVLIGVHIYALLLNPLEVDVVMFFFVEILVIGYFAVMVLKSKLNNIRNIF